MNLEAIKELTRVRTIEVDNSGLIAYIMRNCGMSYTDIGKVLGVSRQRAEVITKSYK